jgi:hypothetical protein
MRVSYRQMLVVVMALLFAASGFAARYCMAAHLSSGHTIVVESANAAEPHHSHMLGHEEHAQHDHGALHDQQAPDMSDVACAKCCGTCTLATAVMPSVAAPPAFVVSPPVFASVSKDCSETTPRVDPGIPKRIA